ncbi:uncharacterized protein LOC113496869 [Trichoplusia ni]|uniref:Uncharacterized protein LOC113496869 n=1 Tax=Trichoplusia ni TaxID=7111 RepID=A0A7E5VUL9_TRINI|nr:uncharacterized protein LOC113496869 [Trichoplusia ni]
MLCRKPPLYFGLFKMDSKIVLIFLGTLLSVNCLVEKLLLAPKVQQAPEKQHDRVRRDSPFSAPAQPNVVVMSSGSRHGVPNSMYRGSYNGGGGSYGVSGAAYGSGSNKGPAVIVNMPESGSCKKKKNKKKSLF